MGEVDIKDITEEQFLAFEGVRNYGRWNMFDPMAKVASGLDNDTYFGVILHYNELREKYKDNLDTVWKGTKKVMKKHKKKEK